MKRSSCIGFSRYQWTLLLLASVLVLSTGCSRMKPRERWWQFWRPKAAETAKVYNPDTVILPPAPDVLDPDAPGASERLGMGSTGTELPPPPVVSDGMAIADPNPRREAPAGMVSELRNVHFAFDSAELSDEARRILDANAAWMLANPQYEIQIGGHTDERGTAEYNLNLGHRRAKAVLAYLVSKGVDVNRLHTISYGEEQPLDPGHNEEAWAKNRRVQFLVY